MPEVFISVCQEQQTLREKGEKMLFVSEEIENNKITLVSGQN